MSGQPWPWIRVGGGFWQLALSELPTCDMDGDWEDDYGREHYWHCERPAIIRADSGEWFCWEHAESLGLLEDQGEGEQP